MASESVRTLDAETLALFASKGAEDEGAPIPVNNANALSVRRVMQLVRDCAKKPVDELRLLDLACGEGVYAIEAALRCSEVLAVDARTERMSEGARAAERMDLENIRFEQNDVRRVTTDSHGAFDVVLFLGILYHLQHGDALLALKNISEMCTGVLIVDTHVALDGNVSIDLDGATYQGRYVREHDEGDSDEIRRARLRASIDNTLAFWFTKESLVRLLHGVGFTAVCECDVPLDPNKPQDRVTVVAMKGEPVQLSSYPWINGKTEQELAGLLGEEARAVRPTRRGLKDLAKSVVNGVLRPLGFELRRL